MEAEALSKRSHRWWEYEPAAGGGSQSSTNLDERFQIDGRFSTIQVAAEILNRLFCRPYLAILAMFDHFFIQLEELRRQTARFRRVALHLHSPDSHDWGRDGDKTKNDRNRYSSDGGVATYAAELAPYFDLVCITDHMRCDFACKLTSRRGVYGDMVVLPGMEVNFRPEAALGLLRIHLLVILPEGSTSSDFAALFQGLSVPNNDEQRDGKNHEVSGISIKEWTGRVHGENGICLAAHVENGQGVRCRFRQTARETLRLFLRHER